MVFCSKCGNEESNEKPFCSKCGSQLTINSKSFEKPKKKGRSKKKKIFLFVLIFMIGWVTVGYAMSVGLFEDFKLYEPGVAPPITGEDAFYNDPCYNAGSSVNSKPCK